MLWEEPPGKPGAHWHSSLAILHARKGALNCDPVVIFVSPGKWKPSSIGMEGKGERGRVLSLKEENARFTNIRLKKINLNT